jgi:superfamily II DNA helicase RecQ
VRAEKLFNEQDAFAIKAPRARERLAQLSNCDKKKAHVLFCTPELFNLVEKEMKYLVQRRMISLIVVDEFDIIQDATPSFRSNYLTLIPQLRVVAPNVQLFFLSATFSRSLLAQLIQTSIHSTNQICQPHFYQASYPLPGNHVYSGKLYCASQIFHLH